jgi:predicted nucleic acid-binding Zn ribbon protein
MKLAGITRRCNIPVYPFACGHCEAEFDTIMTITEYEFKEFWDCPACLREVSKEDRIITRPNITKASYIDGTKRPGFAENREILKLKQESYNMKPDDRKAIKKTIKEIERSGKS